MITKAIKGDLLEKFKEHEFDAIVHGCNCFCTMGAGIAKHIRNMFPEAYKTDCETEKGSKDKLGTYSKAETEYGTIINAYTQFTFWEKGVLADYNAIKSVFEKINEDFKNKTVGIPLIGCGLAGGDWDVVSGIIHNATPDVNIIVYYL